MSKMTACRIRCCAETPVSAAVAIAAAAAPASTRSRRADARRTRSGVAWIWSGVVWNGSRGRAGGVEAAMGVPGTLGIEGATGKRRSSIGSRR